MSGGYFDHRQYVMNDICRAIEELIDSNDDQSLNEYGDPRGRGYSKATIARFNEAVELLRKAELYAHRIDWLVSDDDGQDSFHQRLEKGLAKLEDNNV